MTLGDSLLKPSPHYKTAISDPTGMVWTHRVLFSTVSKIQNYAHVALHATILKSLAGPQGSHTCAHRMPFEIADGLFLLP